MSEDNKELVRRYQEAYNTGDLDILDKILAPDWVTNAWPEGIPQSIENAKAGHRMVLEVFPDYHCTTENLIAEGDWVVQSWTARGTHKGELLGLPPTGRLVQFGGISMFRIADARIVQHLAYGDELGFLEQVGAEVPVTWDLLRHRST
ncbi:MAG: ester cyclase [Actinobacteria bacterium]|nr:ester cyclase [Actinomycetota bacterium]